MTRLPIDPTVVRQSMRVRLGDRTFIVRTDWRERTGAHYLSLYTADDQPIVLGRRLRIGGFPLAGLVDTRGPDGVLSVVAQSAPSTPPGPTELGARVQIVFVAGDEMRELLAS